MTTITQNNPSSGAIQNYSQSKQNISTVPLRAEVVNRTANQAIAVGTACGVAAIGLGIGSKLAIAAAITAPLLPLSIMLGILALILVVGGLIAKYVINGTSQTQKQPTLPSFTDASKSTGSAASAPSLDDLEAPPAYTPRAKKVAQINQNYGYQMYDDNWQGEPLIPPPPDATIVEAFGVVNNNATFDSNYPIMVPPGATGMNFAIGGWNNSQSTPPPWGPNGFYVLVNSIDPSSPNPGSLETTFMQSIGNVLSANPQAWNKVTLDFENYDHTLDPEKYTKLVLEVKAYLKENFPNVELQMAISPSKENRDYFNLQALAAAGVTFQLMCYDYAMGQSNILVLPNAPVDGPEGQETIAGDIDEFVNGEKIPQKQIFIGIPGYGIAYNCAPGLDPQTIQAGLDTWSLPATGGYGTSNGQITDDVILNNIGNWDNPSPPWTQYIDKFGNYYYYNSQSGAMYAANPPACFDKGLVPLIKSKYPGVRGFFQWEAVGNTQGVVMLERVMQDMSSQRSARDLRRVDVSKPPRIQGRRPGEVTPVPKPRATLNPARIKGLASPLNLFRGRPAQNQTPIEI